MLHRRNLAATALAVFLVSLFGQLTSTVSSADTFHPVVRGRRGVVAGGHPLSVEAGLRTLQHGGNAVDAGVATILAASVIEFSHFSFGGEVPILIKMRGKNVGVVEGMGTAPKKATREFFVNRAKNSEGVAMPHMAGTVHEPASPKNGRKAETAAAARSLERAEGPTNGAHTETPDAASRSDKSGDEKKKKSRRWGRRVRRTVWLALAAGAAVALVRGHAELRVAGPFNVLPIENSDVRAAVDGVVDRIYVHEGDYIREGQPVARLTDIDTRAALEKTEAQLAEAGAKLRMQVAGPTANEIEVAKASVTKAEDNFKYAQIRLAMAKKVFDENLLSRKEYEDVAALENAARNDLAVAKDQLTLLISGTRPEDIEATRAQIEQFKADQRHLGEQRRMLTVYSPSTGIVATPTLQLKQLTHQLVKKGDLIAKVFDLRTVTAQIAVDEKDIADVRVNQKVVLRARAYPNEVFDGTVNFVSTSVLGSAASSASGGEAAPLSTTSSSSSSTKRTILITTQIDNHSLLLKPEMTGQAKILCGQRRALDLLTRRLAHAVKVEFWSWW